MNERGGRAKPRGLRLDATIAQEGGYRERCHLGGLRLQSPSGL